MENLSKYMGLYSWFTGFIVVVIGYLASWDFWTVIIAGMVIIIVFQTAVAIYERKQKTRPRHEPWCVYLICCDVLSLPA